MKFTLKGLLPLLVFIAIGTAFAVGLTKDPRQLPPQLIDRPFPVFSLPALDDAQRMVDESLLLGRVSLVNVFGSWCVACEFEHPVLMKLAAQGEVFLLGIDWRDTRENAQIWLARRGNPYGEIVFDEHSKLAVDLGVTGAPETFIVDKKGQIRYKHIGPMSDEIWTDVLRPLVQNLESEP